MVYMYFFVLEVTDLKSCLNSINYTLTSDFNVSKGHYVSIQQYISNTL